MVGGVWCIPAAGLSGLDSSASASMSWPINLLQNRGRAQSAPQNGENCTARIYNGKGERTETVGEEERDKDLSGQLTLLQLHSVWG